MLVGCTYTSSCCTGAYSAEMALAVVEKTINESGLLGDDLHVSYTTIRAHVMAPA